MYVLRSFKKSFRVHFTKESEEGTACSPCSKVPVAITYFYIEQRDLHLAKKGNGPAQATALQNSFREVRDGDIFCEGEDEADNVAAVAEGEARLAKTTAPAVVAGSALK